MRARDHRCGSTLAVRELGVLGVVVSFLAALTASGGASAASSTTVVTATVPSATTLSILGCGTAGWNLIDLGTVLPGASAVSSSDCQLTWGSSNDSGRLRLKQGDGFGAAMFQPSRGVLDPGFDGVTSGNGIVKTDFSGGADEATSLAVQEDGHIVVAGAAGSAIGVARYDTAGVLDGGFGTGGEATLDPTGAADRADKVVLQEDGKIVVAGGNGSDVVVARFTAAGQPDLDFNGTGWRSFDISGTDDADWVAIAPSGKIVVGGSQASDGQAIVMQLLEDGTPDPGFGGGDGIVQVTWGAGNNESRTGAVQDDGMIVVGARNSGDFALARFDDTGVLDPSFDGPGVAGNGKFLVSLTAGTDDIDDVELQPDGKIVALGRADVGGASDFGLVRLDGATGQLDATFDGPGGTGNGVFSFNAFGSDDPDAVRVQPDGKLLFTGTLLGANSDAILGRLDADGSLDATFDGPSGSGDGIFTLSVGAGVDQGDDVAMGADGTVYITGDTMNGTKDFYVAAFEGLTVNDFAAGTYDWSAGGAGDNMFGVCMSANANSTLQGSWAVDGDGDCADGNADPWQPVTAAGVAVANAAPNATNAVTSFRFGFRAASDQPIGTYIAPVTFEVVAP